MVAKSYQGLEIIGEPYISQGRQYVQIRTKKGTIKTVRWYTDKEYAKMYPNDSKPKEQSTVSQKKILGFEKGYITIFKGNTYEDRDYFKLSKARYCKFWGWYFVSTDELPNDLPEDVEPIQLSWDLVGQENERLKSDAEVIAAVESLIYDSDISEYQGAIGDRIERILTVEKAIPLESYYGKSTCHVMRDYDGNCYVWITSAKSWEPGTEHQIAGTVKEFKFYKGVKQTVLTRCREKT